MTGSASSLVTLEAIERASSRRSEVSAAFVTWLVGQSSGLSAARNRLSTATWYRHLKLIKKAGLSIPGAATKSQKRSGISELDSGAGLLRMIGKRFRLLHAFDEFAPFGTRGSVEQILFRDSKWLVGIQFDGSPGAYEELCVGKFARIAEWVIDE